MSDFDKFLDQCNKDGVSQSEMLRSLVLDYCESCENKQGVEPKPTITFVEDKKEPKLITHGKILDDYGNVIGTF